MARTAAMEPRSQLLRLNRLEPLRPDISTWLPSLFSATLFVSACLLFLVQPLLARMVLPLLGGSPAVWTTCMVFFQAALLGGYLYAHWITSRFGGRTQLLVHGVVLALPFLVLPIGVPADWMPPGEAHPVPWLLGLLSACVGLPFVVLAASAPLVQQWFAGSGHRSAHDPYFLYAASNLGSLAALIAYPVLIEPSLRLVEQSNLWLVGYGLLAGLMALCGLANWRSHGPGTELRPVIQQPSMNVGRTGEDAPADASGGPSLQVVRWIALAFVPSSLMLGVTAYLSTDIAAIPLLWVAPLAIYLLTFIIGFGRTGARLHRLPATLTPVAVLALVFLMTSGLKFGMTAVIAVHLGAFFVVALGCHVRLAQLRPPARHLTGFYLCLSVGGVLGGVFNGIVAPLILKTVLEYPLALGLACAVLPASLAGRTAGTARRWLGASGVFGFCGLAAILVTRGLWSLSNLIEDATVLHLLGESAAMLGRWMETSLLNIGELARIGGLAARLRAAILIIALVVCALYVLRRRADRWPRLLDAILPASLLVIAAGAMLIWKIDAFSIHALDDALSLTGNWLTRLLTYGLPVAVCLAFWRRPVRLGLSVVAIVLAGSLCDYLSGNLVHRERSFFGVLCVRANSDESVFSLFHGTTLHGQQRRGLERRQPLTYYHRTGPIGEVFQAFTGRQDLKVAVVGLGTGTLACYGKAGQTFTFYEIDPAVCRIASEPRFFTYLADARALRVAVDLVLGDARLKLAEAPDKAYDLLVVDAFTSDAIPVHLITREAIELYRSKLAQGGVIALHISNRYLDLEPVLCRLAEHDEGDESIGKAGSSWVVLAQRPADAASLDRERWSPLRSKPGVPAWSDDYSNLLSVLK